MSAFLRTSFLPTRSGALGPGPRPLALAVAATVLAAAPIAAPAGITYTATPLVGEGDTVPGVGQVMWLSRLSINDAGDWIIEVDTDHADTAADSLLLFSGSMLVREGDALATPAGASVNFFGAGNLTNLPSSVQSFFLDGTTGSNDDTGVFFDAGAVPFDPVLVVQEGDAAPDLGPGTVFVGFGGVQANDAGQILLPAGVDDPAIPSTYDSALYLVETDPVAGGISSSVLVNVEGDLLPGQVDLLASINVADFNHLGEVVYFVRLDGPGATDTALYYYDGIDRTLLAQKGSPSPVAGRNWLWFPGGGLDVNDAGDFAYHGNLDGDFATDELIVLNQAKFKQKGDPVTTGSGTWLLERFGIEFAVLDLDQCGNMLWYGDWDDPNADIDTGLFLNDVLLVQEGVTMLDGQVVDIINADSFALSDNGRYVIFDVYFAGFVQAAYRLDLGAACGAEPCLADACGDGNGTVDVVDLLAMLADWGGPGGACDLVADGVIDVQDLLALLAAWGDCP